MYLGEFHSVDIDGELIFERMNVEHRDWIWRVNEFSMPSLFSEFQDCWFMVMLVRNLEPGVIPGADMLYAPAFGHSCKVIDLGVG